MQRLALAVEGLEQLLGPTPGSPQPADRLQAWRNVVRQRLGSVTEELLAEDAVAADAWLSARACHLERERNRLLARLGAVATLVAEGTDLEQVRLTLLRLVHDIQHHHERVNDLRYDAVGLDMGGSE